MDGTYNQELHQVVRALYVASDRNAGFDTAYSSSRVGRKDRTGNPY